MGICRRHPVDVDHEGRGDQRRVYAAGVHFGFGRWLVNGSRKGLVALTIDPPEQAKMWKKSMTVRELWVSVTDPDALVTACTAK